MCLCIGKTTEIDESNGRSPVYYYQKHGEKRMLLTLNLRNTPNNYVNSKAFRFC